MCSYRDAPRVVEGAWCRHLALTAARQLVKLGAIRLAAGADATFPQPFPSSRRIVRELDAMNSRPTAVGRHTLVAPAVDRFHQGESRTRVGPFTADQDTHPRGPASPLQVTEEAGEVGDLGDREARLVDRAGVASGVDRDRPRRLGKLADRVLDRVVTRNPTENDTSSPRWSRWLRRWARNSRVPPALSARTRIGVLCRCPSGSGPTRRRPRRCGRRRRSPWRSPAVTPRPVLHRCCPTQANIGWYPQPDL
jgi:hypothetical protein